MVGGGLTVWRAASLSENEGQGTLRELRLGGHWQSWAERFPGRSGRRKQMVGSE